jgi:ABC-2 type transport system permease protein
MKALFAMMRKEFVHIRRDPQLVGFVLALPVLLLILFGYALRLKVEPMRVAVWDNDQAFFSAMIKDQLRDEGNFVVEEVASEDVIRDRLKHGEAHMGVVIPKGFTENLANYKQTVFPVFVDGSMPTLAQAALYGSRVLTSEEAADKMVFEDEDNPPPPVRKAPIKVESVVLFNPELKDSDFFLPGTIGIVVMIVVLTLSSGLVREKEQATIEQLLVTPIGRFALIAGKMIPYGVIAAFDFAVVSLLARFVFDLPLSGAFLPVTLLAALFILALLALGALISTLSQTQLQANFMAVFVIVPSVLMSGFVFPIEAIPHWLQPVAYSLPMTYFVDAIRGLTLKGASMSDLMIDYAVLTVFMVGFTLLSLARFRKQLA